MSTLTTVLHGTKASSTRPDSGLSSGSRDVIYVLTDCSAATLVAFVEENDFDGGDTDGGV